MSFAVFITYPPPVLYRAFDVLLADFDDFLYLLFAGDFSEDSKRGIVETEVPDREAEQSVKHRRLPLRATHSGHAPPESTLLREFRNVLSHKLLVVLPGELVIVATVKYR